MAQAETKQPIKSSAAIKSLNDVGRYAIGVKWAGGHDSIYPLENLRRACPCRDCRGRVEGEIPPASQRLSQLSRLGETGIFLGWTDGHETLLTTAQLRALCRCAHCVAEPERPITGAA
ncbi:MAG: gamma-butyrobetaine hydroxylase-like domain-containing protein [Candidatus Binataceae bacterium]